MNIQHQEEQMEAMRRDFYMLLYTTIMPRAEKLHGKELDGRQIAFIEDLCWQAFRAGVKKGCD